MRTRLSTLTLGVIILALALAGAGCGGQEPASAPATLASPSGAGGQAAYTTVDVQTAHEALDSGEGAQLLDVREPAEWSETGVVPDAVLIPLAEVESRAPEELAADRPVYVICRSGNRSRVASDTLVGLGFTQVFNVDGGITAWLSAGLPVESYRP
jgi:rhodanese-related sulfurtransferase